MRYIHARYTQDIFTATAYDASLLSALFQATVSEEIFQDLPVAHAEKVARQSGKNFAVMFKFAPVDETRYLNS